MLSYAFQILQEQNYQDIKTEQFHNTAELYASILEKGINSQIKRGLGRDYIEKSEPLSTLHGKLDISESLKTMTLLKNQIVCSYDDFTVNTVMNQIIKSTLIILIRSKIDKRRKKRLRDLFVFFSGVDEIDLHTVNWHQYYNRNNQTYQMLISVCYLVFKSLLQSQENGNFKFIHFLDEQRMSRLYEKFILEYYRKEHPELIANASQIPWQLDDDFDYMLPRMQTDIMLSSMDRTRVLIIDAKYYTHTTQTLYGVNKLHSVNLYQIFTYVKNKEYELTSRTHSVSGMLLYARTDEDIIPNGLYRMSGNKIKIQTLNLNCEFQEIKRELDKIVLDFFYS